MARAFVTFEGLLAEHEREELVAYALALEAKGVLRANAVSGQRYYQRIWNSALVTPLIVATAGRVERLFGLSGTAVDPDLGWVISVIHSGGAVHPHKDDDSYASTNRKHLRCNLLVSKPQSGGTPIIDGRPVAVVEGGGWAFFASETTHAALPVAGTIPRIVYQFGYAVDREWELPGPA
jgi:hypothetical protein